MHFGLFIYFMNASDLGTDLGKKPKWWSTALHERRGAKRFEDAKRVRYSESLKENENWIMEATAHFNTSHGMCTCGGESETFV